MIDQSHSSHVVVYGESVVDLIKTNQGYIPMPGGSPFNVARAIGLQGIPVYFSTPLSQDALGQLLQDSLQVAGVQMDPHRSRLPTSVALVDIDDSSQPVYSLYREGIADRDTTLDRLVANLSKEMQFFHCGSLVFIPQEVNKTVSLVKYIRENYPMAIICVDLNIRSLVVGDDEAYAQAVEKILPLADIVKLSDEDWKCLFGDDRPEVAVKNIYDRTNGAIVVMTTGRLGCVAQIQQQCISLPVPNTVEVVDTVGAGDCFQAGMISWLYQHPIQSSQALFELGVEQWQQCLKYAMNTSAFNVGQVGCSPPTRGQMKVFENQ